MLNYAEMKVSQNIIHVSPLLPLNTYTNRDHFFIYLFLLVLLKPAQFLCFLLSPTKSFKKLLLSATEFLLQLLTLNT